MNAYGCSLQKSCLSCEWFDIELFTPAELPGMVVEIERKIRSQTLGILRGQDNIQRKKGYKQKMRAFYTDKGIDTLKYVVSLPRVCLHYLLRGTIEREAELYSHC